MQQLSGLDTWFINMERGGVPMHISSFAIYDPATAKGGKVNLRQIKQVYQSAIDHNLPELRNCLYTPPLAMDQPYWVADEHFDLDRHLRREALGGNGSWDALMDKLGKFHCRGLGLDKPLWEAVVITGLDRLEGLPKGCFGIYHKIHHALMDGRTGQRIFTYLQALGPDEAPVAVAHPEWFADEEEDEPDFSQPTPLQVLRRAGKHTLQRNRQLARLLGRQVPAGVRRVRKGLASRDLQQLQDKAKVRFNEPCSENLVVDRIKLPLSTVHKIRAAASGSTVNDLALTIIGGAMRRYLEDKGELPDASMVAIVPADVRAPEDNRPGNRITFMPVSLASDIADDRQRLLQVSQESRLSKAYSKAIGQDLLNDTLDSLHPTLLRYATPALVNSPIRPHLPCVANTVVTNVSGSDNPTFYLAGARCVDAFGLGPLPPESNLFHTVTSTGEWLNITFVSCAIAMGDPARYRRCLEETFQTLAMGHESEADRAYDTEMGAPVQVGKDVEVTAGAAS